ncbi:MAG: sucrase ferredoxin [Nocardioides sp.]
MTPELSCSDGSVAAGEQLAGSAPQAVAWLALEQNGPWGARAFTQSHLDAGLGRRIEETAAAHGVRPALVRRPGRHADEPDGTGPTAGDDPRRVLLAHTSPGRSWLLEGTLAQPAHVTAVDWAALRDGDLDAVRRSLPTLTPTDRAHLLVCTNGTRDVCCAVKGRPVALGVAARQPDRVWEVTHTSGHRFAATAVLLPAGTLHGRLDTDRAEALLAAADRGETVLAGSRGRSTYPAAGQVAELAVREAANETGLDALDVTEVVAEGEHSWTVSVAHADARRWSGAGASEPTETDRAESCGKALVGLRHWSTPVRAV